jgi:hypothetical protein
MQSVQAQGVARAADPLLHLPDGAGDLLARRALRRGPTSGNYAYLSMILGTPCNRIQRRQPGVKSSAFPTTRCAIWLKPDRMSAARGRPPSDDRQRDPEPEPAVRGRPDRPGPRRRRTRWSRPSRSPPRVGSVTEPSQFDNIILRSQHRRRREWCGSRTSATPTSAHAELQRCAASYHGQGRRRTIAVYQQPGDPTPCRSPSRCATTLEGAAEELPGRPRLRDRPGFHRVCAGLDR